MTYKILKNVILSIVLATSASVHAQSAAEQPRVFMRDLEGIWVNQDYVDALKKAKTPHAVARKTEPVVIAIRREGRSFPMVITNFDRAAVQAALDVEPDKKPNSWRVVMAPDDQPISSNKVKFLWFRGARNAAGKFERLEMAELFFNKGKWAEFVRVGDAIGPFVNGAVIAGHYTDQQGKAWEFSETGEAYSPDQTFHYELSLNDRRADCEYIEGEDLKAADGIRRIGFAWKGDALELYEAKLAKKRVRCESKPFAVLTRKK